MKVIDILNQLDEAGQLRLLYKAGVVNLKTFNQRDIYLRWQTLRASLRYTNDNAAAVEVVAEEWGVCVRTVYNAIAGMEKVTA